MTPRQQEATDLRAQGLTWREVAIARAYLKYRRRVSPAFAEEYQNDAFAENPHIAKLLIRLFEMKFDPAVFPPANARVKRKKNFKVMLLQLLGNLFLMSRAGVERVPSCRTELIVIRSVSRQREQCQHPKDRKKIQLRPVTYRAK